MQVTKCSGSRPLAHCSFSPLRPNARRRCRSAIPRRRSGPAKETNADTTEVRWGRHHGWHRGWHRHRWHHRHWRRWYIP